MWLGGLVMLAALTPGMVAAEPRPDVRYQDGRLSVHVNDVPLDNLLDVVREETGLAFRGEVRDWRKVNKQFEGVPLPEALGRILGRQNFILRYGADGQPKVVELQGMPQVPSTASRNKQKQRQNVLQLLATAPPVPLSPVLHQALRTGTARPTQLLMAGAQQNAQGVRMEARRAFLSAVEANRPLRDALVAADPAAVAPLLRSLPAERVDESLADLARRGGDPKLRGFFLRLRTHLQQERAARAARTRG
jgi:hypothetical protein